jgi:hypothetical protein
MPHGFDDFVRERPALYVCIRLSFHLQTSELLGCWLIRAKAKRLVCAEPRFRNFTDMKLGPFAWGRLRSYLDIR